MEETILSQFMEKDNLTTLLQDFENKAQRDNNGVEFWYARDLQILLGYGSSWQNFSKVINKAKVSCEYYKQKVEYHFNDFIKMVNSGVAQRPKQDYKLTRYACYLIAQNGDTRKEPIAFAQTYFAVQTRRQEIEDQELRNLSESEKRIKLRYEIKKHNKSLASTAKSFGVIQPLDYAMFQNAGYKGLYKEKTRQDIACLLYTSPSPRDLSTSRMPSSA